MLMKWLSPYWTNSICLIVLEVELPMKPNKTKSLSSSDQCEKASTEPLMVPASAASESEKYTSDSSDCRMSVTRVESATSSADADCSHAMKLAEVGGGSAVTAVV
jgi:hypothetical protein